MRRSGRATGNELIPFLAGERLWPRHISEARHVQDILKKLVRIVSLKKSPRYIAAADASFHDSVVIAVATLYTYPSLEHLHDAFFIEKTHFPYVPGFLAFREGHAIIAALNKLRMTPDVILFDGQGIAHPKKLGIASHIGVILNLPTIGCAKSRLVGEFEEPGKRKGSAKNLYYNRERVGTVLRTRDMVRPVFVSPGHLVDCASSVAIVRGCTAGYRIPEPLRRADAVTKVLRQARSHGKRLPSS